MTSTTDPERRSPGGQSAVVVGGGLAGITSALALADAGVRVTLLEGRPRLGGAAFSFRRSSPVGELTIDNGQHVYLRCCTGYGWFLDRIGASHLAPLQDRLDVPVLDVGRSKPRLGRLRRTALPVPLHLAATLATYPHLSPIERAAVGRAALALKSLDPYDPALDTLNFGDWLRRKGQSARAIESVWDVVAVATLNARSAQCSLGLATMVFKTGLLTEPGHADIGIPRVPLGELHDTRARATLEAAGVGIELRSRVTGLDRGPDGRWDVQVETAPHAGTRLTADTVVLALPQQDAHALLPTGALDDPGRLLKIGTAPILNLHVVYDRPVLRRPFFVAIGSPVQWVFDRSDTSGLPAGTGQYLAVSQSAAHDDIDQPVSRLRERYLPELARLLPAARGATVRDFFVTRERTATFAPAPGVGRLRPPAPTNAPGLFLAGAWTATGWPATMESAVRSGLSAAGAALSELGRPHRSPLREAV